MSNFTHPFFIPEVSGFTKKERKFDVPRPTRAQKIAMTRIRELDNQRMRLLTAAAQLGQKYLMDSSDLRRDIDNNHRDVAELLTKHKL